jgi:zinc transporter ZupT
LSMRHENDDHWRKILLMVIAITVHNIPEVLSVSLLALLEGT